MDFFVWQDAGGVNSWLFTTSATQAGGKRRDYMARLWVGIGIKSVSRVELPSGAVVMRYEPKR
jgi:hypothetical protein